MVGLVCGTWEKTMEQVKETLQEHHVKADPNHITAQATVEWLRAFKDMVDIACKEWSLDIIQLVGWS